MTTDSVKVDIALYVALSEEFFTFQKDMGDGFSPVELPDVALTCFLGSISSDAPKRSYKILVIPAGKMGISRAGVVISAILDRYRPDNVVVLGIAGSLASELQPGDVFIPDRVVEYLANSATVGTENWEFQTSGNHYSTDPRLLNRLQFLPATQATAFVDWRRKALSRFKKIINAEAMTALKAAGLQMRAQSEMIAGDDRGLASGPAVGKGEAFVTWLKKSVDRKLAAIEMESAGVFDAAFIRIPAPRVMAIRGISDFADERKEILEKAAKGGFRKLAIKNSITLFITAVKAGLFQPESPSGDLPSSSVTPIPSLVSNVFVIGGETGETEHPDFEASCLQSACLELGKALAKGGVRMIVCSPFPDSADCYTVRGYSRSGLSGEIEFHSPDHPDVDKAHEALKKVLGKGIAKINIFRHPGYEDDDSRFQGWLLAQLKAVDRADVVVAIGGKISKTASTLLHLAEDRGIPIVPYTFLKGAAQRAFDRSGWNKLHPKIDAAILNSEDGIDKVIEIANQLLMDKLAYKNISLSAPNGVFISRAKEDAVIADKLMKYLNASGFDVLLGDGTISPHQMAQASIEQAIQKSDIFVLLWSKYYALSPWCYDELALSLEQSKNRGTVIWLFCLDDTPIVPKGARKLRPIRVNSADELLRVTKELLLPPIEARAQ